MYSQSCTPEIHVSYVICVLVYLLKVSVRCEMKIYSKIIYINAIAMQYVLDILCCSENDIKFIQLINVKLQHFSYRIAILLGYFSRV